MAINTADPELTENRVDGLVSFGPPDLGPSFTGMEFQTWDDDGVKVAGDNRDRGVGEKFAHAIPTAQEVGQITLTRTYRIGRDKPVEDKLKPLVGVRYAIASKVYRDLNMNRQTSESYGVLLEGVIGPKGDTNGNGKGMLTLIFGVVTM